MSETRGDQYVFHFFMSNRLLDRHPCRGVLHTPHIDSTSTPAPLAGRLVGRMQYAPTFPEKDKVSSGWCFLLSRTMADKYVFHSIMSNRLSDGYPCRGVLHTPHIDSTSTPPPFAGRLIGRMQYAPTLPAEKSDLKGWREDMFGEKGDEYVFHSIISNRLSDRYPGRAQKHTPLNHSRKGYLIARQTIAGRMQYASTFPEKDEVSLGRCFPLSRTMADKYVSFFSISNRLSDMCPCRAQKHTPLVRLLSTLSPLAGRLVGRMQYAPTLSKKDEGSSGRYFLLSRTVGDKYVSFFSMSNQLSNRQPCRGVLNTPHIDSTSTPSPLAGRLVGRMQYAPTLPEKDEVSSGWCFPLSQTMRDQYVFLFSMSNRLSDGYSGRAQKHTPLARLSSNRSPLAGRLVGRMQYAPTFPEKEEGSSGRYFPLSRTMADKSVFLFSMSNRLSDRQPGRGVFYTPI